MNLRIALVKACKKHGYDSLASMNASAAKRYSDGYATPIKVMEGYKRKKGKLS